MNQTGAGVEVFVFKGRRFLGSRCFSNNAIVIGSSPRATLKLRDPAVSERHAIVRVEGGQIVIADNDSNTGVFVNGARINTRTVSSFDEIAIGPFRMKLSLLGGAEEEDPGFGGEEEVAEPATTVRRVDDVAPSPYARTEAELQRVSPPQQLGAAPHAPLPDEYETDVATHADSPAARARVLGGGLAPAPSAEDGFEDFGEVATKRSSPGRSARGAAPAPSRAARRSPEMGAGDMGLEEEPAAPRDRRRERPRPEPKAKVKARRPAPAAWDDEPLAESDDDDDDGLGLLGGEPEEPLPPDPGPPLDEDDEDDDDDEENFVEPFSLLENVVRERFKSPAELEDFSSTEVIRYKDGEILDLMQADPGAVVTIGLEHFRLVNVHESGHAQLFFDSSFSGTVVSGGKARSIKRLRSDKYLVDRGQRIFGVELSEGDYAQLLREDGGYLVRFVRPPRQPRARDAGFRINWNAIQMFIGSAAFHFLMVVVLGFASPSDDLRVDSEGERFAKIALKDVELEKAVAEVEQPKPEEPKPEEPKTTESKKPPPPPKPTKQPRVVRRPRKPTPGPPSPSQQQAVQRKQVKNVLSALQNLKPADGPGRADLKALASNIAAVRVPGGGSASDFRIAGVIKKIPGGGVRLGGGLGGGGGKGTRSGSQLLRGTGIGNLTAAAGTGTRVRGRVRRAPTRAISASGGSLSREAIQKVVSEHMHEVQACYERQLITNPGMAGKIVFDWVITPSGSVGSARQVSSTMRSPAVASCILGLIRTWRFPQPVGGSVNVRYPFVFRVQGF